MSEPDRGLPGGFACVTGEVTGRSNSNLREKPPLPGKALNFKRLS
ncbi:MAG: hypothetical protein O2960_22130 [Verrucomicrobia bacterium]|nr:hypothetical protein [Verrucomicrobiota bacterium]